MIFPQRFKDDDREKVSARNLPMISLEPHGSGDIMKIITNISIRIDN